MKKPTPLIVGNWKMNGLRADLQKINELDEQLDSLGFEGDVAICPPATLAALAVDLMVNGHVKIGGQDCHAEISGAYTGDISAEKWKDLGATYVIVGHSERRAFYREDNDIVNGKARAAIRADLIPIICVGETLAERDEGRTLDVLAEQIRTCIPDEAKGKLIAIGYEPVWAVGTGHTPTLEQIQKSHELIRHALSMKLNGQSQTIPITYGGSLKPDNAFSILSLRDVDGGLVGGASLQVKDFMEIVKAAKASF